MDAQTAYMTKALTPEQVARVAALNLAYAQKAEPILKGSGWAMTKAEAIRTLQDAKDGELQPILTADQLATYRAGKDAMKAAVETQLAEEVGGR